MAKKHIITLTGQIASGKGVVSEILLEELKYQLYKVSDSVRQFAKDNNMTINEFQTYVAAHPEIDQKIEAMMGEYADQHDNLLIETRTGWFIVPDSFKVYLRVDVEEAAKRVMNANRGNEEQFETTQQAMENINQRQNEEDGRWLKLYGKDITNMDNFDFVFDTTNSNAKEAAEKILEAYYKWLEE